MSTTPTQSTTGPEFTTTTELFTTANAPRTFDPFNTNDCPGMFNDRWQDTGDGPESR